ncbi:hypothetical protein [Aneurinibacillus danicus]|uniref:hypothetical protein n=1 Tax=Aneurinibacillus danicus TaxID=267746 RepID=UPI0027D994FC|nr:hypothetical protein [Aneurinibacillus danicus]
MNEFTEEEAEIFWKYKEWFGEVEKTAMNKSYKMVLLLAMLERGPLSWEQPVQAREIVRFFYDYLTAESYRLRAEARDRQTKQLLSQYDEERIARLIREMPMDKWSGSSKGLVAVEREHFSIKLELLPHEREKVFEWTRQICEFRLHHYFERR